MENANIAGNMTIKAFSIDFKISQDMDKYLENTGINL